MQTNRLVCYQRENDSFALLRKNISRNNAVKKSNQYNLSSLAMIEVEARTDTKLSSTYQTLTKLTSYFIFLLHIQTIFPQ